MVSSCPDDVHRDDSHSVGVVDVLLLDENYSATNLCVYPCEPWDCLSSWMLDHRSKRASRAEMLSIAVKTFLLGIDRVFLRCVFDDGFGERKPRRSSSNTHDKRGERAKMNVAPSDFHLKSLEEVYPHRRPMTDRVVSGWKLLRQLRTGKIEDWRGRTARVARMLCFPFDDHRSLHSGRPEWKKASRIRAFTCDSSSDRSESMIGSRSSLTKLFGEICSFLSVRRWIFMWVFRLPLVEKAREQIRHRNGRSPVWVR